MATKSSFLVESLLIFLFVFAHTVHGHSSSNGRAKPFSFLNSLEGCQKGQKMQGINGLKDYLNRFGYLSNQQSTIDQQDEDKDSSIQTDQKDVFDETLESAIKTYQLNYGLPVTGYLDTATVKQMTRPRCGVPDIINGTTHMHSGQIKFHRSKTAFYGTSLFKFFPGAPRWSNYNLKYKILVSDSQLPTSLDVRSILSAALNKWEQVTSFTFQEVSEDEESDIEVGFYSGDHGDGEPFDGPGGVLGHSFAPTNGRSHYDADEDWSNNPDQEQMDLESVMVHEFGHILGLGHTSDESAIMYPSIGSGVTKRDPQPDDIQGLQYLYGSK